MTPSSPLSTELASSRFKAYEANCARAALWAHPLWFEALLGVDTVTVMQWRLAFEHAREATLNACSRALVNAAQIVPPPSEAWRQPALIPSATKSTRLNLSLLDMLPAALGLQTLRMRALLFRRDELRRMVDKRMRLRLSEWAGVSIDVLLANGQAIDSLGSGKHALQATIPPIDGLDADQLAEEGLVHLERDLGDTNSLPFPLLRLALAPGVGKHRVPWLAALPPGTDANSSAWLFTELPNWIGTWSWLFG